MSPQSDRDVPIRRRDSLRRSRGRALVAALTASMLLLGGVALASTAGATLKPGSSGAAVKQLQRKLRVQASGYYGSQTKRAVKRWQAAHRLTADGIAGPATLDALGVDVHQASAGTGGTSSGSSSTSDSSGGSNVKLPATLKKIAECESGGDPTAVSPSGRYRGKYQFDKATWKAAGGSGDPAKAPEATQDRIALALYHKRGTAPWPNCG